MRLKEWIIDSASGPFGSNLKVENFISTGFPIIDGANLKGIKLTDNITKFVTEAKARSLERSIAKRHDVVVTISGTLGQISYIPYNSKYQEYLCSQRQFRVTFDETKVSVKYLVYYFHTQCGQKKILAFANYVGVPALSQPIPNFKNIEVDFHDLNTQIKIVEVLSALDDKIDLNNKVNQELEKTAKDLYDYWFVQFDFPDENKRPYKSSGGKMVYNEKLKREIPDGWVLKYIKNFCNVVTGKEDANFATEDGIFAFFTCGDEILKCNKPSFEGKSILVAGNGNFNVKYYEGLFNAYQRTYVLIPEEYIYIGVMHRYLIDSISRFAKGANGSIVKFITKGDIENTPIVIPKDLKLLEPFNKYLSKIHKIKQENKHLSEIRDFLLPMLMNGQVSVAD